jgi:hypothetical protein
MDDLNAFAKSVTCDKLGEKIVAALAYFKKEVAARAAAMPNSPQLVLAAQTELVRLGCKLPGKPEGALNESTKTALQRFLTMKGGKPSDPLAVTIALVNDLKKQTGRVCPLECNANEVAKGDKCVAIEKPPVTSRRKDEQEETPARKKQPERRQAEREPPRKPVAPPEPHVRQQATARPTGGGGGGGSAAMTGVGF